MKKEVLLAHFPKLTHKRYQDLIKYFGNLDKAWVSGKKELKNLGWKEEFVDEFVNWRDNLDVEKITKILEKEKINCITKEDPDYPELLQQIYDPPICLFVRGSLKNLHFPLAVVGPRKFSQYGEQVTQELISELARKNITIVSGLALGIDGIAHQSTLDQGGKTIAVLGSGNNEAHVQPGIHRRMANKIIETGGAVITEYPPGTVPNKYTFPRRNRIIAGMSLGTLVIEASQGSGSLITAECALEGGRDVFTVPQNITSPTAAGSNNLLKMGAKVVTDPEDILDALNLQDATQYVTNRAIVGDTKEENLLIEHLSREPKHVDEISKKSSLPGAIVNSTLTIMEMKGKVRNLGNMMYVLAR